MRATRRRVAAQLKFYRPRVARYVLVALYLNRGERHAWPRVAITKIKKEGQINQGVRRTPGTGKILKNKRSSDQVSRFVSGTINLDGVAK